MMAHGDAGSDDNVYDHRRRIRAALTALLRREDRDTFVIFQERTTEKFVQFAGSAREPLFLDLPSMPLNSEELARARTFFGKLGVSPSPLYADDVTFQLELGTDVEHATEIALSVFREIYRFPFDFELEIIEN